MPQGFNLIKTKKWALYESYNFSFIWFVVKKLISLQMFSPNDITWYSTINLCTFKETLNKLQPASSNIIRFFYWNSIYIFFKWVLFVSLNNIVCYGNYTLIRSVGSAKIQKKNTKIILIIILLVREKKMYLHIHLYYV